jgi:hypothetical protein
MWPGEEKTGVGGIAVEERGERLSKRIRFRRIRSTER